METKDIIGEATLECSDGCLVTVEDARRLAIAYQAFCDPSQIAPSLTTRGMELKDIEEKTGIILIGSGAIDWIVDRSLTH